MKIKRLAASVLLPMISVLFSLGSMEGSVESQDRESLERFLRNADIISIDKGVGIRTDSWRIELMQDGVRRDGFFKLTDRQRPHPSGGDSYKYVLAAYELDKLLDLNLVPPTVEKRIERENGSLMLYLSDVISESARMQKNLVPPDPEKFECEMAAVNIFEHLLYFPCLCNQTDPGNILIQTNNGWKVWMIDLSTAFAPAPRLITGCPISCCPKELFERLIELDENAVKTRLKSYLTDQEVNAIFVRKDLLIERIKELIEEKGEESVLLVNKID